MPTIEVHQKSDGEPLGFAVTIRDAKTSTQHQVTLTRAYCDRLTGGHNTAHQCIDAAFRFLLDREPKESILQRFDVAVIARYFPEFERELPRYLKAGE
jgi:hypothetical protein